MTTSIATDAPRSMSADAGSTSPLADGFLAASGLATIVIAATFTVEGLRRPLSFMLEQAELDAFVEFAPYNQIFQELMSPSSLLARNRSGTNVVLVRLEDFVRDAADGTDFAQALVGIADEFVEATRQFARRSLVPLLLFLLRSESELQIVDRSTLSALEEDVEARLRDIANVTVLGSRDVDALCDTQRLDAVSDKLAHIPYTDDYVAALAIVLARRVHLQRVAPYKVLVLDCDNTIWRGVVGEDGVDGIGLDPAFLAVQRFATDVQAQGALVCLASKNVEADVMEVFDVRADMLLRREHVVAHRVNWEAKSSNLRSLARELNLGLDSFVFIDDNPVECGQMLETLPEVVTLQLPVSGEVGRFLANLWTFDKASVTQEDQRRTEMYRQNAARESLEANTDDIGEFLASLQLHIDISAPAEAEWARVAQLTYRTNQFNFTTRRRTEGEMRALEAGGALVLAVRVRDRFGDYGLVGVIVAEVHATAVELDTFLLSCRVLGRGVEHAMVAYLGQVGVERQIETVQMPLVRTPKNEPALAFANSILAAFRTGDDQAVLYAVPATAAAAITHRAGEDAAEVIEARKNDGRKASKAGVAAGVANRSARYDRLTRINSGATLMRALRTEDVEVHASSATAVAPATDVEQSLLALWADVLGLTGFGVEDDYFALGGTSLQAARMIADIAHRYGVSLPLTTIIESPTIRALASRVEQGEAPVAGGLVPLKSTGDRTLFLVHDGDGETLLYRNIARRVPGDLQVFGIQPQRKAHIPLVHMRIEDMATCYVELVKARQPAGPYLLGGMCAGGLIAFEMARQLQATGNAVSRVLLLDAATPDAERKPGPGGKARSSRLRDAIDQARAGRGVFGAGIATAGVVVRKIASAAAYEVGKKTRLWGNRARIALLRRVLREGRAWPLLVPSLDFRAIYNHAEWRYKPRPADGVAALLVRARAGSGSDMPYIQLFNDPTLGWGRVVKDLLVADVDGGHSSMLQEPHAASLASVLRGHIAVAPFEVPSPGQRTQHAV